MDFLPPPSAPAVLRLRENPDTFEAGARPSETVDGFSEQGPQI